MRCWCSPIKRVRFFFCSDPIVLLLSVSSMYTYLAAAAAASIACNHDFDEGSHTRIVRGQLQRVIATHFLHPMIFCQLRRSKGPREPCPIMFSLWPHERDSARNDVTEEEDIHAVFSTLSSPLQWYGMYVFLIQLFEFHIIIWFFLWSHHPTSSLSHHESNIRTR